MDENQVKERLLIESDEFRRIFSQHRDCEIRLKELSSKSRLSSAEEQEVKALKKKKLGLKDRMYTQIVQYMKKVT